jgi:hypothetical protein
VYSDQRPADEVEADRYERQGRFYVFYRDAAPGQPEEVLRVSAWNVRKIEEVSPPS